MSKAKIDTGLEQHKLYNIPKVAEVLGVSLSRMRDLVRTGSIHARQMRTNGEYLIPGWAVNAFVFDGLADDEGGRTDE